MTVLVCATPVVAELEPLSVAEVGATAAAVATIVWSLPVIDAPALTSVMTYVAAAAATIDSGCVPPAASVPALGVIVRFAWLAKLHGSETSPVLVIAPAAATPTVAVSAADHVADGDGGGGEALSVPCDISAANSESPLRSGAKLSANPAAVTPRCVAWVFQSTDSPFVSVSASVVRATRRLDPSVLAGTLACSLGSRSGSSAMPTVTPS